MIIQCCVCKKVRRDGVWVKADSQELQDSQVSHSYCPACAEIASQEIKALLASSPATPTA